MATESDVDIVSDAAERLLERALQERRDGLDAITTATAAIDAMRIEAGELPQSELAAVLAYLDEDEDEVACTCPPGLVDRGGFRSSCPAHG